MTQINRKHEKALNALARPVPRTEVKHRRSSVRLPRRVGILFRVIGKHLRTCYQQLDGSIELADVCTCDLYWEPFRVIHPVDCEIDEHKLRARSDQEAA